MQKWFCEGCGRIVYLKTKPPYDYQGKCPQDLAAAKWKLISGGREMKLRNNQKVHGWQNADEYENRHGSFPTVHELEEEFVQRQERWKELKERTQQGSSNSQSKYESYLGEGMSLPNFEEESDEEEINPGADDFDWSTMSNGTQDNESSKSNSIIKGLKSFFSKGK